MNDFFFAMNEKEEYKQVVEEVKEGNQEAKTKFAWFLLSGYGVVQIDEDRAVVLLEERVKDKDAEAMWMMGLCYEYGMGCETSVEEAEALYKRCCEGGNAIGEFLVENGERNERGSGSGFMGWLMKWVENVVRGRERNTEESEKRSGVMKVKSLLMKRKR